jgi:uncharacterized membrane protein YqaE (UPF0057 family)
MMMTLQNNEAKCSNPLKTNDFYLHTVLGVLMPPVGVAFLPNAIGIPLIENLLLTLVSPPLGVLHALFLIIQYHFFTVPSIISSKTEAAAVPTGDSKTSEPQPIPGDQAIPTPTGEVDQPTSALTIPQADQPLQPHAVIPIAPSPSPATSLPELSPPEEG